MLATDTATLTMPPKWRITITTTTTTTTMRLVVDHHFQKDRQQQQEQQQHWRRLTDFECFFRIEPPQVRDLSRKIDNFFRFLQILAPKQIGFFGFIEFSINSWRAISSCISARWSTCFPLLKKIPGLDPTRSLLTIGYYQGSLGTFYPRLHLVRIELARRGPLSKKFDFFLSATSRWGLTNIFSSPGSCQDQNRCLSDY